MYNYKIIHDTGRFTVIRAKTKSTAIRLFLYAEGCSRASFDEHYIVRVQRGR
jgi:hypothetical protein